MCRHCIRNTSFFIYTCIYFIAFLSSCNDAQSDNKVYKQIIPKGTEAIVLESASGVADNIDTKTVEQRSIRSFVPQDYIILDYVKEDLSGDGLDEDIVLYTTYSVDTVYVFIASFDDDINAYRFVWQSSTNVVSEKSLSLSIRDITGDSRKEIVIRGSVKKDDKYLQSIEVFHIPKTKRYDITKYQKIFENATNSDIDIENVSQDQATEILHYGKALPIILYNINEETRDIVKSFYHWDVHKNTYIYHKSVVFNRANIVQKKIDSLYYGGTSQWQEYLHGIWRRTENNEYPVLLYFSNILPHVSIYTDKKLQVMQWVRTVRAIDTSGLSAQIYVRNMVLSNVKKWISIRIIDDKNIDVYLGDDITGSQHSGRYTAVHDFSELIVQDTSSLRLANEKLEKFINRKGAHASIHLYGSFKDTQDNTLYIFHYPKLQVISSQVKEKEEFYFATFNVYSKKILQIKNISNLYEEPMFYFIEIIDGNILLKPVHISFQNIYNNATEEMLQLVPID